MRTSKLSALEGVAVIAALVLGCEPTGEPIGDTAGPAAAASGHPTWDVATVEHRLIAAGLHPSRDAQPVRQPFMTVPATLFRLGSDAEIQVFIYPDSAARARDTQ